MTIQEFNLIANLKKKGTYRVIKYKTNSKQSDDYKIVTTVVRMVKYVSESPIQNRKPETDKYDGYVKLHINKDGSKSNTVLFHTTGNPKHVLKVEYYNKDNIQITKQEYELTNENKNHIGKVFCKKVDDLIWMK